MIRTVAGLRTDYAIPSGYLFGYLRSRVEQFLKGFIDQDQLAHDAALMELLYTMCTKLSREEIREVADGTRELAGEDVQSGQ